MPRSGGSHDKTKPRVSFLNHSPCTRTFLVYFVELILFSSLANTYVTQDLFFICFGCGASGLAERNDGSFHVSTFWLARASFRDTLPCLPPLRNPAIAVSYFSTWLPRLTPKDNVTLEELAISNMREVTLSR